MQKDTLSTTDTTSTPISGWGVNSFAAVRSQGMTASASYQVKYATGVTTGNFEVALNAGFDDGGTVTYGAVATITQDDVNKPVTFPIGLGLTYRFAHVSGVNVDVLIG